MNPIEKGILQKKYKTRNKDLMDQTWGRFYAECDGRKLFVWSVGQALDVFLNKYNGCHPIEGFIDADKNKQGLCLANYLDDSRYADYRVISEKALDIYQPYEIVVLVTSPNYYEDIIAHLNQRGISCCYSLLHMEYNDEGRNERVEELSADDEQIEINENKIAVYGQYSYSNHEKYIINELLKIRQDLDIVWVLNNLNVELPNGIRPVYYANTKRVDREIKTAKIWLVSTMIPEHIKKRPGQIMIHVKHWASITLKKFYLDAPSITKFEPHKNWWEQKARETDYIIVGSEFDAESCRRGISDTAELLYFGSPRSDVFYYKNNLREQIRQRFGLDNKDKIILYAPTYRFAKDGAVESHVLGDFEIDLDSILGTLEEKTNDRWAIVVRLHPGIRYYAKSFLGNNKVIDASTFEDSQELVAASDMMITDFSSIMFEGAFAKIPVLLYAPDKDEYLINDYELLIDYDSLPFPISTSTSEICQQIKGFDKDLYQKKVDEFLSKYDIHEDGHASERAAHFISELLTGTNIDC